MTELEREYTMAEVTEALQMSERWLRYRIAEGASHQRYGHKIRFTTAQVQELRDSHTQGGSARPHRITTGPRRRRGQ